MTKNKAMRLGSVMLVLALLTTCAISGTFAKYTSSSTTQDNARVAYWGFAKSDATTLSLFDHKDGNVTSGGEVDGVSKVIAPGTKNDGVTISFNYTPLNTTVKAPEVAYSFDVTATNEGDTTFLDSADGFKWTLKVGTEEKSVATTAALLSELNKLSVASVSAGTLPSTIANTDGSLKTVTIGWSWDYEADGEETAKTARDTQDTGLGNANETDLQNIKLKIVAGATQKD